MHRLTAGKVNCLLLRRGGPAFHHLALSGSLNVRGGEETGWVHLTSAIDLTMRLTLNCYIALQKGLHEKPIDQPQL